MNFSTQLKITWLFAESISPDSCHAFKCSLLNHRKKKKISVTSWKTTRRSSRGHGATIPTRVGIQIGMLGRSLIITRFDFSDIVWVRRTETRRRWRNPIWSPTFSSCGDRFAVKVRLRIGGSYAFVLVVRTPDCNRPNTRGPTNRKTKSRTIRLLRFFPGLHTVSTEAFSVRVVSWVTLLFGLCISTSYSAVLFSRLAVDKSDIAIPTLDTVARMRTHALCVRRESFGYLLFKVTITSSISLSKRPLWVFTWYSYNCCVSS